MRALRRLAQGRVLLLTICAAGIGGTFQFGYNLSIINAPTLHIQEFTNETWQTRTGQPLPDHLVLLVWSLIVSLYPLGGLLGALLAGPLAVTLGRELLGGPQAWPLLLASCLVPGALQLASLPLLPESPRYLLIDCGDPAACRAALQRLRGPADLAGELAELEQERAACRGGRARRPWELFRERALRRQVASLVVLGGAMELCGNDAMYAYASAVFSQAGIPQDKIQYAAIGTGGCELLATLLSGSFSWTPYLAMACIFAFILSFGIGPAGVTGILATELFDQMARPAAYMVCGALMWTMLFLVGLVFPFLVEGLSHFIYVPFLCVCVCAALYSGIFLPETRGKSFVEISEELHRLNFPGRSRGPAWAGPEVVRSTEL
ncbi:hypothetical protein MG293_013878 [Ovis ammon polii]|uniref:Solute carrier family 2 member 11 n=1 Tax=Ovis ammon polii TaxID=230172 RepID=A0AAD4Y7L1_OVIAM|nr:hypothetical protein MG293_013878 [Ovis ammon polii]KAI4557570.1 hypothetical protein MJT46_014249 [Ovis ammon polii x Ovis aries]